MKFSIVTICFNPGQVLRAAVASVLGQSYRDLEYLIVDGGSTDGTAEWLSALGKGADSRVRVVSEPDGGLYDALNKGVRWATGDVVGFVHADDYLAHEDVLGRVAARFEAAGVEAVYGDLQYVAQGAEGGERVIRHWRSGEYSRKKLRWGWMPPHPALYLGRGLYGRAVLGNGEYFDTSFSCAADYDFMLRLLSGMDVCPVYLPEVLVKMRVGGVSNRSVRHVLRKSCEDWRAIRRNGVGHLHTLVGKNLCKLPQFFHGSKG